MLGWLWRLFSRKKARDERQLFRFWDGTRYRRADPVELWAKMEGAAGEDWTDLLRLLAKAPPPGTIGDMLKLARKAQQDAATKIAEATCAAFDVSPFAEDGTATVGLTKAERIALAASFLGFIGGLAGAARPFLRSPSPTGPSPTG